MPRPATLDHLRSQKKPVRRTITIALDSEIAERYASLKADYDFTKSRLQARPDDELLRNEFTDVEERFLVVKDEMEDNAVSFKFRSIGRQPFEDLVMEHRPTKEQKDEARKSGIRTVDWNPETFPVALIAASSTEPILTPVEVKELWESEDWNQAELLALFGAAMEANQQRQIIDLGKE